MRTTMTDPKQLLPHPFNERVYGHEPLNDEFLNSIRESGVLEPVVAVSTTHNRKTGLYILSGHRRVVAAIQLNIEVPVRFLPDEGREWQESFLLEANRQRVKTPEQMAREYSELKRIEIAKAEARRENGEQVTSSASSIAATQAGVSDAWARKMEVIYQEADDGNPVAVAGLAAINAGTANVDGVFRDVTKRQEDQIQDHHANTARRLESQAGIFTVQYSPRALDPKHGFMFKTRFICVEEAEAFLAMLEKIPAEAREEFERAAKSWRK